MTLLGAILTTVASRHYTQASYDAAAATAQKNVSGMNSKELVSVLERFLGLSQETPRSLVSRAAQVVRDVNCQGVNPGTDGLGIEKCHMIKSRLLSMLNTDAVDAELYFPSVFDEHLHGAKKV